MSQKILLLLLSSLFLLSACDNSEKEARTILNKAVIDWQAGQIQKAEEEFSILEKKYIDTVAATDGLKTRETLKEKYKLDNSPENARRNNRGIFARMVSNGIENYHQQHGAYPDQLAAIQIHDQDKYLPLCTYKKALFDAGYQLNCEKADVAFMEDQKAATILRKNKHETTPNEIKKPADFPKVDTTWKTKFNPSGAVPEKGFYAYYINTNDPHRVVYQETVQDISINYPWSDFHNIKSENFGAYWIGRINLLQAATKTIAINQSWAKTRLIIDGFLIYEGGGNREIQLNFEQGEHLIEVEHVNNWHTTEFSLSLLDDVKKMSPEEISTRLANAGLGEYEIYYAGVYESKNKDMSLPLNIQQTDKKIVLVLSSYSPVRWRIANPFKTDIRAIVYGSYSPGVIIGGDVEKNTLLLPLTKAIGSYSITPKNCTCVAGRFHCEEDSILSTKQAVRQLSNAKMTGASGAYSPSELTVPQVIVDENFLLEQERKREEIKKHQEACQKQGNPNFDTMFDQKANSNSLSR